MTNEVIAGWHIDRSQREARRGSWTARIRSGILSINDTGYYPSSGRGVPLRVVDELRAMEDAVDVRTKWLELEIGDAYDWKSCAAVFAAHGWTWATLGRSPNADELRKTADELFHGMVDMNVPFCVSGRILVFDDGDGPRVLTEADAEYQAKARELGVITEDDDASDES